MTHNTFNLKEKVWVYKGPVAWYFVTIDKDTSAEIKRFETYPKRGFGAIKVKVTAGETTWETSVFWEKKGTYILPIKKEIRHNESIKESDIVEIVIKIIDK